MGAVTPVRVPAGPGHRGRQGGEPAGNELSTTKQEARASPRGLLFQASHQVVPARERVTDPALALDKTMPNAVWPVTSTLN